jgi:alpha-D-xyloside xylohydrolase
MDWPADPNAWTADTQFMAGDDLLVAPYVADRAGAGEGWDRTDSRDVYLPAGTWHDFWADEGSDKVFDGGTTIRVELPLGKMPLFVRSGALLPLAEPVEHVAGDTCFDLAVRVYGRGPARAELFEDDGVSFDFEKGRSSRVELSWSTAAGGSVHRTGGYGRERYRVSRWETRDRT